MIEFINTHKCTGCNTCVKICPLNVFEKSEEGVPTIARQSKCQTCFMCELYCPADALYVAPNSEEVLHLTEQDAPSLLIGSYRRNVGWAR